MSKYRNIKVHVPTPEISEKVQLELAKHGCRWQGLNQGETHNIDSQYLYISCHGFMRHGNFGDVFIDDPSPAVPYQPILDPLHDVKVAWANGEVVQYKSRGEWHDWENMVALVTDIYSEWRVKPKTKTIKQWERRYWDGDLVITLISTDEKPDWSDLDCHWIGEPALKTYEVPNDQANPNSTTHHSLHHLNYGALHKEKRK